MSSNPEDPPNKQKIGHSTKSTSKKRAVEKSSDFSVTRVETHGGLRQHITVNLPERPDIGHPKPSVTDGDRPVNAKFGYVEKSHNFNPFKSKEREKQFQRMITKKMDRKFRRDVEEALLKGIRKHAPIVRMDRGTNRKKCNIEPPKGTIGWADVTGNLRKSIMIEDI